MKQKIKIITLVMVIFAIILAGFCVSDKALEANFAIKNSAPTFKHIFGTDNYGRDVFFRTISGLSKSLVIGILASIISGIFALIIGIIAGIAPKWVDSCINFVIDAVMSIPHLVLLILISFCLGKGLFGVVCGIIFTHWTGLARVIRGEVLQIKEQQYIKIAKKLGSSPVFIAKRHILPHIIPQFIIGIVILFPHAILHESAITFLGFGLPPESPTIGIMLSESMNFVMSNMWWLFLPGVSLVIVVILFDILGKNLKKMYDFEELRR
ncbi:MAG: ABC transporter permease [Clostridia bacterium]